MPDSYCREGDFAPAPVRGQCETPHCWGVLRSEAALRQLVSGLPGVHRSLGEAKGTLLTVGYEGRGEIFSTHSLRAGGAAAMWACNYTVEQIQRRGRWASQCFRIYIWEGRERAVGLAKSIFNTSVSIMPAAMKAAANREERGRRLRH